MYKIVNRNIRDIYITVISYLNNILETIGLAIRLISTILDLLYLNTLKILSYNPFIRCKKGLEL